MANKGRSTPGLFGTVNHHDSNGKKVGRSEPGIFGGYTNYDASGKKVGHSSPGVFGGYSHYDSRGNKTGSSSPSMFGGYNHRDASGRSKGSSSPGMFGGYNHSSSQGCYVATCVYGSYDCPQVWTLRRFRDDTLAKTFFGRMFIRIYYVVSPTIVKHFGSTQWFQKIWHGVLDRMVSQLKARGVADTPYNDKPW